MSAKEKKKKQGRRYPKSMKVKVLCKVGIQGRFP